MIQAFSQVMDISPWFRWFLTEVVAACIQPKQTIQRSLAKPVPLDWLRRRMDMGALLLPGGL